MSMLSLMHKGSAANKQDASIMPEFVVSNLPAKVDVQVGLIAAV